MEPEKSSEKEAPARDGVDPASVLFQTILGCFGLFVGFVLTAGAGLSAGGTVHMLFLFFGIVLFVSSAYVLYQTGTEIYRSP